MDRRSKNRIAKHFTTWKFYVGGVRQEVKVRAFNDIEGQICFEATLSNNSKIRDRDINKLYEDVKIENTNRIVIGRTKVLLIHLEVDDALTDFYNRNKENATRLRESLRVEYTIGYRIDYSGAECKYEVNGGLSDRSGYYSCTELEYTEERKQALDVILSGINNLRLKINELLNSPDEAAFTLDNKVPMLQLPAPKDCGKDSNE